MLKFDLQFFNEEKHEDTNGINAKPADVPTHNEGDGANIDSGQKAIMIPKSRFDEVNEKFKEVNAQLQALLDEKAEAERLAKEKQGQYEELYTARNDEYNALKASYDSVEARKAELETVVNSLVETKLKNVPDEFKDLVPDNLSAEAKLDWLNKAEEKGLFTPKKNNTPIGGGANPPKQAVDFSKLSPTALLQHAYGSKR